MTTPIGPQQPSAHSPEEKKTEKSAPSLPEELGHPSAAPHAHLPLALLLGKERIPPEAQKLGTQIAAQLVVFVLTHKK